MAFTIATLQRIGAQNAGSPTLWTYSTADSLATCDTAAYFNGAADRLKVEDWILISVAGGNSGGIVKVNQNTRDLTANPPVQGVVDVTSAVALASADSD